MTVQTPAKINVALRVGSVRPDGFHPLTTVFCALDLTDEIIVEAADELTLVITGIDLEVDDNNLVLKAARILQEKTGTCHGAQLTLNKKVPVAAGLAGGSADGAGTLVALNALWELGLGTEELHKLACELGSDVPFALLGGLALGMSRGDELTPIRPRAFQSWVLVTDKDGLSTPEVFAEYDRMRPEPHEPHSVAALVDALGSPDITALGGLLANDLAAAAFRLRPNLAERYERLKAAGVATVLSGSGPTIGILCDSDRAADVLAQTLKDEGLSVLRADGPAAGAHIVRRS